MVGTKGVLSFFFPFPFHLIWGLKEQYRVEKMGMQRVKRVQRNRKEMIYSKSFAGIGLHLHPVSPTALSLSLLYLYLSGKLLSGLY